MLKRNKDLIFKHKKKETVVYLAACGGLLFASLFFKGLRFFISSELSL